MNKKWLGRIFIASAVVLILNAFVLAIYYLMIKKGHEGPMEPWAIPLLIIPGAILCISRIIIEVKNVKFEDSFSKKGIVSKIISIISKVFTAFSRSKVGRIISKVFMVVAIILMSPVLLVFVIIEAFLLFLAEPKKKTFKKLIKKGFAYKKKDKKYVLTKENIIIEISFGLVEYRISFDGGESFVNVEESDLGTSYARESLKQKLEEYKYAHPVDKQRGEAIPPIHEVVEFLNSVLD